MQEYKREFYTLLYNNKLLDNIRCNDKETKDINDYKNNHNNTLPDGIIEHKYYKGIYIKDVNLSDDEIFKYNHLMNTLYTRKIELNVDTIKSFVKFFVVLTIINIIFGIILILSKH